MSIKKLEGMLKKLDKAEKELKSKVGAGMARRRGGSDGCSCCPRCGVGTGGRVGTGGGLSGGVIQDFAGGRKRRGGRPCGGVLSGGVIQDFAGGQIQDFAGGQIQDFAGGKRKRGRPRKSGGILLGGIVGGPHGLPPKQMATSYRKYDSATTQRGTGVAQPVMGGRYAKGKRALPPQLAEWRKHLADFRNAHPNMSLSEAMKGASKTFKKRK